MRREAIVKQLLQKAKDSALLAIEFYNKPAVSFKSEGFITMMCIAWTSLFHAYFFKNKIKPYYRKSRNSKLGPYEKIKEYLPDGNSIEDIKWWDLSKCIKEYFKDKDTPVRKNLEFFSGIRNLIVHRNIPELDPNLYGECQANILNFNQLLIDHFGLRHRIDYMLSYSLQMYSQPKNFIEATKRELKNKNAEQIIEFIKAFRSLLTDAIFSSPEYAYKAVLIKVKNHETKDAFAIRFINEKDLTDEQQQRIILKNLGIVIVKDKEVIKDGVPANFKLLNGGLWKEIKSKLPHINQRKYNKFKKYLRIKHKKTLAYERQLDENNPKSPKQWFYDVKIINEFRKLCPKITPSNEPIVRQIEALVDQILMAKKQNPQADTSDWEKEIDRLVDMLNQLTPEEITIIEGGENE